MKRLFYVQISHWYSHLGIAFNLWGTRNMGSFPIIVVKLSRYKDSDVRDLQKIKYFAIIIDLRLRREIRFNYSLFRPYTTCKITIYIKI